MIQVNWAEVPPLYPKNINRQFLIRVTRLALVDINNHRGVLVMIGDGDNITWEHLLGSATAHTFHLHNRGANILSMAIVSQVFLYLWLTETLCKYLTYLKYLLKVMKQYVVRPNLL